MKWSEFKSFSNHDMFAHVWRLHMSDMYVTFRDDDLKETTKKLFTPEILCPILDAIYPNDEIFLTEAEANAHAMLLNGPIWKIEYDYADETVAWPHLIAQDRLFHETWKYEDGLFSSANAAAKWISLRKSSSKPIECSVDSKELSTWSTHDIAENIHQISGNKGSVSYLAAQVSNLVKKFNEHHDGKILMPGRRGARCGYIADIRTWHDFFLQFHR